MATNPRIPPDQRNATEERRPQLIPGGRPPRKGLTAVPGVLFAIVVAAALLAALIYYLPRAPKKAPAPTAAQAPVQPVSNELQFTNMKIDMAPTGGAMELVGNVINSGNRPVLGATVQLTFFDSKGTALEAIDRPLVGMVRNSDGALATHEWGTDPVQPNQTRMFRVTVDQVPATWNHLMPGMKVLSVATEGNH